MMEFRLRAGTNQLCWATAEADGTVNILALAVASGGATTEPLINACLARTCVALHGLCCGRIVQLAGEAFERELGWRPPPEVLLRLKSAPRLRAGPH